MLHHEYRPVAQVSSFPASLRSLNDDAILILYSKIKYIITPILRRVGKRSRSTRRAASPDAGPLAWRRRSRASRAGDAGWRCDRGRRWRAANPHDRTGTRAKPCRSSLPELCSGHVRSIEGGRLRGHDPALTITATNRHEYCGTQHTKGGSASTRRSTLVPRRSGSDRLIEGSHGAATRGAGRSRGDPGAAPPDVGSERR